MITLYNQEVRQALKQIPDETVSCVMTSPPYWALRDYGKEVETIWDEKEGCEHNWDSSERKIHSGTTKSNISGDNSGHLNEKSTIDNFCSICGAWKGQLGLEPTFDLYIKHLCDIFDEVKRVLRKDGTCFVNLGDSYSGNMGKRNGYTDNKLGFEKQEAIDKGVCLTNEKKFNYSLGEKNLCNIPARFSIEMQNRGWILRNELIWYKRNCMPSSVKDRFTVDFEKIFFFTKNKKYWFERQYDKLSYIDKRGNSRILYDGKMKMAMEKNEKNIQGNYMGQNKELGKNKRCVWDITTRGYKEAHFATFPEELVKTPILSGCPEFICSKCGKARYPIYKSQFKQHSVGATSGQYWEVRNFKGSNTVVNSTIQEGLTNCNCSSSFIPGIVLDPFAGSGTTLKVARDFKRDAIGIEIKQQYCDLIFKRLYNGNVPLINEFKLIK